MSKKLEGRIALVTGSSRGIGCNLSTGGRMIMIGSCVGKRALTPGLVP